MLQRVNELRGIKEGLLSELKTSQTIAAELRCRVVDAERKLLEKEFEEFKGSLERVCKAYRDVGYQSGLKDRYSYSSQGMKRKETLLYNSKANKQLAKLDKEFGEKTPALLAKIIDNPLMSLDELKSLLTLAGPSSPKSLTREDSP
ncbi:hypothetical protein Hdeb2414_s0507g00907311 [Helianthus debilis subsp. tardiflorus]